MSKRGNYGSGNAAARTYNLSMVQMRNLFQVYHSLVLAAEHLGDPLVIASATKLQELLFSIPRSDLCNPLKDVPDSQVTDWSALK